MDQTMKTGTKLMSAVSAMLLISFTTHALAQPPAHAKAHGYRAKHVGHTGVEWDLDFGITSGTCNRKEVATVLGGLAGGLLANRIADDSDNRAIATLIGAAAGAFIGNRIGDRLDDADQACVGHALELGDRGQTVNWTNESTGVRYQVVPGADRVSNGRQCREFDMVAVDGSQRASERGLACQSDRGVWQIVE